MSNRQVFPAGLFPLRGDISAEAGATSVIVQGIQGIPVIAPPIEPAGLDTFFYDSYNNDWFYASPWDIPVGTPLVWEGYGYGSSGISWIAPDTLAFGNGTDGDVSGAAAMTALVLFGSASYYGPYNDYDVDYGPSYDQFYTSIFSGATQNWNLILPPNPGTVGQVLTTNGTGVSYWSTVASSGGSVTSFSSGNLSPLFTTSVATPTTTPALSFSLNTQNANTVFAGPTSGGAATPTFRSLVAADLPAGTGTVTSVGLATGSGASDALYTISGSPVTTSGTLVETLNTQAKNTFLGGPISGANATPTFRGLNSADIPVPGSTGDILYNNGGVLGASLTTITAAGSITIPDTQTIQWTGSAYSSVGLSQLAADTLAVGNGTESDVSGGMAMTALILYGSSYYSAYDAFHTTIYSGATQNWNLVLPETAGTNGQVLVNIGSGFTEWESVSNLGVPWSALTNASAALTLNNATFNTTFQQQAGDVWTWGLASYTAAVSNSPTLTIAGSYQSGTGTFAEDSWTIINTPTVGTTNGVNALIFTHSGTTGNAVVQVPKLQFSTSSPAIDVNANGYTLSFTAQNGGTTAGSLKVGAGIGNFGLVCSNPNNTAYIEGTATTTSGRPSVAIAATGSFTATGSVTQVGLCIGANGGPANGAGTDTFTFNPASGSASFVACEIVPTIKGTSTGSTTAFLVNPTTTATNLTGTNLLLDLQNNSTSQFSVSLTGLINMVSTNTGFGNGSASTAVTTTTKGTGHWPNHRADHC